MKQVSVQHRIGMKKLADLIIKNPDLPVITMTDNDDTISGITGGVSYIAGCLPEVSIDYIYSRTSKDLLLGNGEYRPYVKSFDEHVGLEILRERVSYRDNTLDAEYLKKEATKIWNNLAWRKVILVYSGQLENADDVYKERGVVR
ncbi:TPA_asm: hypothetical protein GYZ23_07450 [Listeria monocytogenes]|nr:hypothetical protein [Listeria monocytogenes]